MWTWILVGLGVAILLGIAGAAIMPKLPSSSEEKQEMEIREQEKRIIKSGEITSKRKWFLIYLGMCVPVLNIVLIFIIAFKKEKSNPTLQNWAKANIVIMVLGFILSIVFICIGYFLFGEVLAEYLNQLARL